MFQTGHLFNLTKHEAIIINFNLIKISIFNKNKNVFHHHFPCVPLHKPIVKLPKKLCLLKMVITLFSLNSKKA